MAANFWVFVFYNTLTCDKTVILLFCLGHEGKKDAWYIYFTRRPLVV